MPSRPHHLLFVCSGNICRSPVAEHLARHHAARTNVELEARSAGTLGLVGRPADPSMVTVGAELGLDLGTHLSQAITDPLVEWADHILVMEIAHMAHLEAFHPASQGKVALLGRYDGVDEIPDPIGSWFTFQFRRSRDQLQRAVNRFVDQLPTEREIP
ncbi:MAG: low molecular weight phosphotyrosine protein phosphatase [Alphaproteobacteria bacterium]|nr:low molecular weight phosphotyrosine protein phosphatase [Alphaproteobacteria bacterium]